MEEKILIVDDQAIVREDLKDRFEKRGFIVKMAKDGLEALSNYRSFMPDLILLDAMIPKLHGFQVCKALKDQEKANIPIIIMTGVYLKSNYKYEAINKYKADSFITKPFDYDHLFQEVYKLLNINADIKEEDDDDDLHFFLDTVDDKAERKMDNKSKKIGKEIDDILKDTLKDFL